MTKHLADHQRASHGGRMQHFLRIARDRTEATWAKVWQRAPLPDDSNRRVVEYVRIARGRRV
jgi:hypothetical protein